jgi:peptidoglycan/xylan/chitin deacetylase (PgdA/CDA1 family)
MALAPVFPAKAAEAAADCSANASAMPVSRIVEVDATGGPLFGALTDELREPSFLKRKEIVLTFDAYCAKAMFFAVGRMAIAYPSTVRDIVARGHTLGSHTYSHPYNLPKMSEDAAKADIERGLAAVSAAAGQPATPFFRFTGLADSPQLLSYLASRHIASFTVDVVTNDSYISDTKRLVQNTIAEVERTKGGIILFHDIKPTTAKALPEILTQLKAKGYKLVHVTAARPSTPTAELVAEYAPKVAKGLRGKQTETAMLPFYGAIPPEKLADDPAATGAMAVTALSPAPRDRNNQAKTGKKAGPASSTQSASASRDRANRATGTPAVPVVIEADAPLSALGGWTTQIKHNPATKTQKPVY